MPIEQSADEVRQEHLHVLGPELGSVYDALHNEYAWLIVKWRQFVELYGITSERVDLLNRAAGLFFRVVQDSLFEDVLLTLARFTDTPRSMGEVNLTIQALPPLVRDPVLRDDMEALTGAARVATDFARDWRNRRIAHRDLALAVKGEAQPLALATRSQVEEALKAVSRVLNRVHEFYFESEIRYDIISLATDAVSLLYVLRDGVEAEERLQERVREGRTNPEDYLPPRPL